MTDLRVQNGSISLACTRSGTTEAPPVLFLHGITGCRSSWLESTERLGDRFDCWTLDFRGHGESDRAPDTYRIQGYASDAVAVLDQVGRPTVVVGHSLGGMTALQIGHAGHPLVGALFLEDPPLSASDPTAFAATNFPRVFAMLREALLQLRDQGAPFEAYLSLAANSPSPMGGVIGDHLTPRHVRNRGLQMYQFDPSCLDAAIDGSVFADFDATQPLVCPVTVLAANQAYGAAFLPGDGEVLKESTPNARVIEFPEVGHLVRASTVSEARFLDELDAFVTANSTHTSTR